MTTIEVISSGNATLGGFPIEIEIQNEISYNLLLSQFLAYEIMIARNYMTSYFGFNFDRKSNYKLVIRAAYKLMI